VTIRIHLTGQPLSFETSGLTEHGYRELRASVDNPDLSASCAAFLKHVANYILRDKVELKPDQTLAYGYWLTKFNLTEDGLFEIWEYDRNASEFIFGASLTLSYWNSQHRICKSASATFSPPRPDKKIAISIGVLDGDDVEGVRYPSPEHMSGWWFTTPRYNGDVDSLQVVPLFTVTAARPDLSQYIALPPGYRFSTSGRKIWHDAQVASSKP
jgi:hypothetical protein